MTDSKPPWIFGKGAWIYDPLVRAMFLGGHARARRLALQRVARARPKKMLELGAGTGLNFAYYPPASACIGVDNSEAMLLRAERRIARLGASNIQLCLAEAERLPFRDHAFDAALLFLFCSQRLPHAEILREVGRVTASGGTIVIVDHFRSRGPIGRLVENVCDIALRPLGLSMRVDVLSLAEDIGWRVMDVTPCPGTMSFIKVLTVEAGR